MNANAVANTSGSHFVDRQDELDKLDTLADAVAMERRPRYAIIYGDPGIGKTTILDRFLEMQVSKRGSSLYTFRATASEGIDSPLYPFASAVEVFLKENPNTARKVARLAAAVIECVPGIGPNVKNVLEAVENLRSPLGIERYETDQFAIYSKYSQMIQSISTRRMLIFCMDDAQWLDVSSRMLLESIVSKNTKTGILFVISARKSGGVKENVNIDVLDRIHESVEERSLRIEVKPLTENFYWELIRHSTNSHDIKQERVHEIYKRTNGNPYWLSQSLAGLVGETQIPGKFSKTLDSKLDEAYENVPKSREALGYAAVLGRRFDLSTLASLLGMDIEGMFCVLAQLQKRGIVQNPGSQEYFTFDHDITREHVYESLGALRKHYHKKVAEFLECDSGNSPNPYSLAYHYSCAECKQKALQYMRIAARASEVLPQDAAEKFEKCLEIAQDLGMRKEEIASIKLDYARVLLDLKRANNGTSAPALPTRGLTHVHLGMDHVKDSMKILEELIGDEYTPRQEKAISHVLMSRCHRIIDTVESGPKAIEHAQTAIDMLQGGDPKLLGEAYAHLATVYDHFEADDSKTKHAYKEATKCYQDHPRDRARLNRKAGMVSEARQAIETMKESLMVFEEHGMNLENARCLNNIGAECLYVGAFQDSVRFLRRSIKEFQSLGTHEIDIPLNNLGLCYLQDENYKKAMQYFTEALDKATEPYNTVFIKMNVSTAYRKMGHPHEAIEILRELEKDVMDLPEPTLQDYYGFNRGVTHREIGEWDEAEIWLRKFPVNTYKDDRELAWAKRMRALSETFKMQGGIQEISGTDRAKMEKVFATMRPQKWLYETDYYPCDIHIWA